MALSRKDYVALAEIEQRLLTRIAHRAVLPDRAALLHAVDLANFLQAGNRLFDVTRFMTACGYPPSNYRRVYRSSGAQEIEAMPEVRS